MTHADFNDLETRGYVFKIGDRGKGIEARYDKNTDALIFPRVVFDYVYELIKEALSQEPCADAVSRDAVKELIKSGVSTDTYDDVEQVCKWIDALPSVTQKSGKWIPVSERLPEEFADVFCSTDAEEVFIATYLGKMNDGVNCFDDDNGMMCEGDVIAWMPLPKPYEPQESEDKE